ncbi:SAM-dependent methyltransferase [Rubritalea squalenifaciens]|uniref:SAM-dependent methyltransferase n=1 Tax=Rubritalea squalenifaciens TaxID=407226 RepID=UPI0011613C7C|nr:SAM-dependent methyltransferase [Rubritalea squalenifaciens]
MRFDSFMQYALHHPSEGYYARKIKTVGPGGDFSTTATLSPILGRAIAARAIAWLKQNPGSFHLIEIGAGDGSLAKSVLNALPIPQRWKVHYHIVETSEPLTEQQKEKLNKHRVTWHDNVKAALSACRGRAVIFSNELVDAFPVRILCRKEGLWNELHVENGQESFHPCTSLPESSALQDDHPEDYRVEIHESYRDWMEDWLPAWHEGEIITIDYGDTYPEIYHRRPHGTIRAFLMHQLLDGPAIYQNVGMQDLTADVNFTDLMDWGNHCGLTTLSLVTQNEFLAPHATSTSLDHYLTHPDGPGSAFKVLIQAPS